MEDDRKATRILAEGLDEEESAVDIAGTGVEGEDLGGVNAEALGEGGDL